MRRKPPAMRWTALIAGLLTSQGCAGWSGQVGGGDPTSPGHWVVQVPLEPRPWDNLSVYGGPGDRTYLGCLRCPGSRLSLDDARGRFRSAPGDGVFKESGGLRNPSSNYSPCNRHGTSPPVVFTSSGMPVGRLTINTDLADAAKLPYLRTWVADVCAGVTSWTGARNGLQGSGVLQDSASASRPTRQAQPSGASGQIRVGRVSFDGPGVSQDDAQTVMWLRSAAQHGATWAQYELGKRYAEARGVPLNPGEAYVWASVAATLSVGFERQKCIDFRDRLAAGMTPEDIAVAQISARRWLAEFAKGRK